MCVYIYARIPLLVLMFFYKELMARIMRKLVLSYVNNKGTDQPAHPRSLISAFVVRCLDSNEILQLKAIYLDWHISPTSLHVNLHHVHRTFMRGIPILPTPVLPTPVLPTPILNYIFIPFLVAPRIR